ncbi:MAG TPA: ATP-dependent protease LonB [Candidatus Woesearchaeota archaeon]|mgnify:CR=1 FL=1|nr:ATP-dependent protease LonB [Candidatus Woesearchaeota archaeon]
MPGKKRTPGKSKQTPKKTASAKKPTAKKVDLSNFKSTDEIAVPDKMIDQVIGQEKAVEVMRKAAKRRRHVLLIGAPGTGKSMLGMALAELLPKEKLMDIICYPNPHDENQPLIREVPGGKGREVVEKIKIQGFSSSKGMTFLFIILFVFSIFAPWWIRSQFGDIMAAASMIGSWFFLGVLILFINLNKRTQTNTNVPKLVVDNYSVKTAPFFDATGAHAGALLGDVLHDPFQSGGLGTPAQLRVVAGMIHKAHMGVLFIDEIATLRPHTQQELLTSLQEGKFPITGQSEKSAGSIVRTEPVPCKYILVAAGNYDTIKHMHPALRSRIRGYGYEVYMNYEMKDNTENRTKIVQFIAQEIKKDGKIPHFTKEAAMEIVEEAKKRANRKGYLSIVLRDLGGVVRAAGDLALEEKSKYVERGHVLKAKKISKTLEQQISEKSIDFRKQYQILTTEGSLVGRVNGLAVMGVIPVFSGLVMPIEVEVMKNNKKSSRFIATGNLQKLAQESVTNVSAMVKKLFNEDLNTGFDFHIQFLQTEGVEGDSASIAVASGIISALKKIPVRQDVAMTGSLSVRGEVLPIGGVTAKVEAAIDSGIKQALVPVQNIGDIVIEKEKIKKIKIIPVSNIIDVLENAFDWNGKKEQLSQIKKRFEE